ncbi:response regulator [Pseudoduganella sp. R-31]|uniref:response regulator n=1 Tax=Pseudoduganella sp. R-31 TaxID=3404060 RepID=UPI003CF4C92D
MHSDTIAPFHKQQSKTVFIIDDNAMMRSMMRLGANEAELAVLGEAGTAQAGLARCMQLMPDIVLLDLGLPDGDGLELLSELKARSPDVFVIVVSGHNDQEVVRAAVSRGALGFIVKPFSIGSITDTLIAARRRLAARQ